VSERAMVRGRVLGRETGQTLTQWRPLEDTYINKPPAGATTSYLGEPVPHYK